MKLIIDIPENVIGGAKASSNYYPTYHFEKIWRAIANGIPYDERPKGKWIKQENKKTEFFCSECGRMIDTKPFTRTDNFPFCHCGTDMRGDKE